MAIAEPADPLGLWARIKPAVGWPDSNEDVLAGLATGWRDGMANLGAMRDFDTSPVLAAWPDDAGTAFHDDTTRLASRVDTMTGAMGALADHSATYATEVAGAKATISDGVHRNLAPYAATYLLPPAIGEPVREQFAATLAGRLGTVMPAAAQRIRSAEPPDEIDWGIFDDFGSWVGENLGRWGDFARGYTQPSGAPDPNALPRGKRTPIPPKQRPDIKRALESENETADALAKAGYDVEQNPPPKPNGKEPDYLVEGNYFDNIAPTTDNPRNIATRIGDKVAAEQVTRVTLNISDTSVDLGVLRRQLRDYPIPGLEEVLLVNRQGAVGRFYP